MDYRLEVKPAIKKDGQKYRVIQITDIALHTAPKTPTPSVGKKIEKASAAEKADRIYRPVEKSVLVDPKAYILGLLAQDPDFLKVVQGEEAKGYKVLVALPKDGIPVDFGRDTKEFLKSKNGQRILRGLAKEEHTA